MKKLFLIITLLAFMTACGGGKQNENTDNTNDSSTTTSTEGTNTASGD